MCALHGTWAIATGAHGMPMTPRSGVSIRPGWGVGVVGGRRQRALEVKPCKGEAASVQVAARSPERAAWCVFVWGEVVGKVIVG